MFCSRGVVWHRALTPLKVASKHAWQKSRAPVAPTTFSLVTEASPSLTDITLCRCVPRRAVPSPAGRPASLIHSTLCARLCEGEVGEQGALPISCSLPTPSKGGIRLFVLDGEIEASHAAGRGRAGIWTPGRCLASPPVPCLHQRELQRRCKWSQCLEGHRPPGLLRPGWCSLGVLLFCKHFRLPQTQLSCLG